MRNINTFGKKLPLLAALAALFVISAIPEAMAQANIFQQVTQKIGQALFDIRKIIYIVGALGLVTFTYAAIFNKISFKHLANICFSLFLVSMLSPFVRYFSGSNVLAQLEYGDYLSANNSSAPDDNVQGNCSGNSCPTSPSNSGGNGGGILLYNNGGGNDGNGEGGLTTPIKLQNIEGVSLDGLGSLTSPDIAPIDISGLNIPTTTPEVDTRTSWQKFKDGIKTVYEEGKKGYETASTVYTTYKNTEQAINDVKTAFEYASETGNIGDWLQAGAVLGSSATNVVGGAVDVAGAIGGYTDTKMNKQIDSEIERLRADSERNPDNAEANNAKIEALERQRQEQSAAGKTAAALGQIRDVAGEVESTSNMGIDMNNLVNDSIELATNAGHDIGLLKDHDDAYVESYNIPADAPETPSAQLSGQLNTLEDQIAALEEYSRMYPDSNVSQQLADLQKQRDEVEGNLQREQAFENKNAEIDSEIERLQEFNERFPNLAEENNKRIEELKKQQEELNNLYESGGNMPSTSSTASSEEAETSAATADEQPASDERNITARDLRDNVPSSALEKATAQIATAPREATARTAPATATARTAPASASVVPAAATARTAPAAASVAPAARNLSSAPRPALRNAAPGAANRAALDRVQAQARSRGFATKAAE